MRRTALFSLALLLCIPAAQSQPIGQPASLPYEQLRSQRMATLSPSLREWVQVQGRKNLQAPAGADAIGAAARERLAGQQFADADIETLVQLVMMETAKDADEELRDAMAQMQAANRQKQAMRDSVQRSREAQREMKGALRDSYDQRTQLAPVAPAKVTVVAPPPAAPSTALAQAETAPEATDSLGDLSSDKQLRLQMLQDRRAEAMEMLANIMKKQSETSSTIIGNLK
jgi:hypothetical protein